MEKKYTVSDYKAIARQQLLGKYGMAVAIYFLTIALNFVLSIMSMTLDDNTISGMFMSVIIFLLDISVAAGITFFFMNIAFGRDYNLSDLFYLLSPAKGLSKLTAFIGGTFIIQIVTALPLLPSMVCFVSFFTGGGDLYLVLATILLIAGFSMMVYLSLCYALFPYIMIDSKEPQNIMVTLAQSAYMMRGNKVRYLYMQLSFIGWLILCVLTFGIGTLWVVPYINTSNAVFYYDVKRDTYLASVDKTQ